MTFVPVWFPLAGLAILTGCANAPSQVTPVVQDGWMTYAQSRIDTPIVCGAMPIQLTGNRLDTKVTGECQQIRITGAHNDIVVEIAPGGSIEILGSNDDVSWRQTQPGSPPRLIDTGANNTFHHLD